MKPVTNRDMDNLKAALALEVARSLPKKDRVASVKGLLQCDEDEARELISRGRRLARAKEAERVG